MTDCADKVSIGLLIVGYMGLLTSLIYRMPQLYKLYKVKDSKSISAYAVLTQSSSYIFYFIYSWYVYDTIYILTSAISLFQNILILIFYVKYRHRPENPPLQQVVAIVDEDVKV